MRMNPVNRSDHRRIEILTPGKLLVINNTYRNAFGTRCLQAFCIGSIGENRSHPNA